jgi:hypothetical protein
VRDCGSHAINFAAKARNRTLEMVAIRIPQSGEILSFPPSFVELILIGDTIVQIRSNGREFHINYRN